MKRIFLTTPLFFFFTFASLASLAQKALLRQQIQQVLTDKHAIVGVAIKGLENGDTLSVNNNIHYPMQSVFKFHIALAVLNMVDKGKFTIHQKILIKKSDLLPNTWSPLRDNYPNGNIQLPLDSILIYTVAKSDNNGCDILLRLIGGPKIVNYYMHIIGIKNVAIAASEEDMHKNWAVQFTNWTIPTSVVELLQKFYDGKILAKPTHDFLWKTMLGTETGNNQIKAQLPTGTLVAHKTGSSGTNAKGVTAALNDVGIVTLPNGKHFAIAIFVSNSTENDTTNPKIIADIAKLVWDYFVGKGKRLNSEVNVIKKVSTK